MASEKVCIDCNISKPIDKFPKVGRVCHPCGYIRRTKGKIKTCKICNESKTIPEFLPKSNLCKMCVDKEKSENTKLCSECKISKPADKFALGTRVCKSCEWAKKASKKSKECRLCNETKVASEFTRIPGLCKMCFEKEKSGESKTCTKCNSVKSQNDFDSNRFICKECLAIQKRGGEKFEVCKVCNETKSKFKRGMEICLECSNSEKFKNNKLCRNCEEIKPNPEFYGASWVCKPCSKEKFHKRVAELKKCEGCLLEKENKLFRELSSKRCLECEDTTITRTCRDCNETKSISEFNPKRAQCHECEKADGRLYRRTTTKAKEWVEKNSEKMAELQKNHYEKNKKEIREIEKKRRREDKGFGEVRKYKPCISSIIRNTISHSNKLCVDRDLYMKWIKFNFRDGMTFDNYADIWCIDHVIPLSLIYDSYNHDCKNIIKKNPENSLFIYCWYNTIPLLKKENRLKDDKITQKILTNHLSQLNKFFKETDAKKDRLYCRYKKFIRDVLEFIRY